MKTTMYMLLLMVLTVSCKPSVDDSGKGRVISRNLDDFHVTVSYLPTELILSREMQDHAHPADDEKRAEELEAYQFFNLRIDSKDHKTEFLKVGLRSTDEYYQRLQYLTSRFQDDIYLVDGQDTLPCMLHHFERNFKMASYGDISLVFEKSKRPGDKTLVFDDQVLGMGTMQFHFDKKNLVQLPKLIPAL